jgi:hypothetical protein
MPSTFSPSLRLELIGNGEQAGNWGNTTNTNLGSLLEQAITGVESIALPNSDYTLLLGNGVPDQSRNAVLVLTGTLTAARNVICPSVEKVYLVRNQTVGGFATTIRTAAGTGVEVANGSNVWVYCDGTNVLAGGPGLNPTTNTVSGTMETATRWATARQLTVTGDASGSLVAPWDGSTNATLNVTIPGLQQAGVQSLRLANTLPARVGAVQITESDTVNILLGGNVVRTFQGAGAARTGNIVLSGGDVTTALGYSPLITFNGRGGPGNGNITLLASDVTTALGATAVQNAVTAQTAVTATNFSGTVLGSQVSGTITGASSTITGILGIGNGGTGQTTPSSARAALGAASTGANTFSGAQTATGFGITNGLDIGPASVTFLGAQESVFTQNGQVQIAAGGTARFRVGSTEAVFLVNVSAPQFITTSDRSLKTDVLPVSGALGRVMNYQPVTYKWSPTVEWADNRVHEGFIAQDVELVNPVAVTSSDGIASLDAMAIIADLVGAVQTLEARIAALEAAQ